MKAENRLRFRFYSSLFACGCLGFYITFGEDPTARMACAILAIFAFAEFISDALALRK